MQRAFSLIELSIVIVILGLLVGGIMAGQALIRSAELRSVVSDFQKIQIAMNNFVDQYEQLPGDGNNMFDYFGTDCAATALDCNGNSNGFIGDSINGSSQAESWRAIKQLALAGLIEGNYAGVTPTTARPGTDFIASSINDAGFWLWHWGDEAYFLTGSGTTPGAQHNWIHFGGVFNAWPASAVLTPAEAENIDKKMDDGMPGSGRMLGAANSRNCSTSADPATARYQVSWGTDQCALALKF